MAEKVHWDRSTVGWREEGTVLYVEHGLSERVVAALRDDLESFVADHWPVQLAKLTGARTIDEPGRTRFAFGQLEVVGRGLMWEVDPEALRRGIDDLVASKVLVVQQQIDQEEKHREDFLRALRGGGGGPATDARAS